MCVCVSKRGGACRSGDSAASFATRGAIGPGLGTLGTRAAEDGAPPGPLRAAGARGLRDPPGAGVDSGAGGAGRERRARQVQDGVSRSLTECTEGGREAVRAPASFGRPTPTRNLHVVAVDCPWLRAFSGSVASATLWCRFSSCWLLLRFVKCSSAQAPWESLQRPLLEIGGSTPASSEPVAAQVLLFAELRSATHIHARGSVTRAWVLCASSGYDDEFCP